MNHFSPRKTVELASNYTKCLTSSKPIRLHKIGRRENRLFNSELSKADTINKYTNLKAKHRKSLLHSK